MGNADPALHALVHQDRCPEVAVVYGDGGRPVKKGSRIILTGIKEGRPHGAGLLRRGADMMVFV
jgi:hypothetical protein